MRGVPNMRRSLWLIYMLIPVAVLYVSCGDEGAGPGIGDEGYFPNRDGSTWTYEFNDDVSALSTWNETRTVNGTRDVSGVACQIMEVTYSNGESETDRIFIKDNEESRVDVWGMERLVDGTVEETFNLDASIPLLKYPCYVGANWHVYSAKGLKPSDVPFAGFENDDLDDDGIPDSADVTVNADVIAREDVNVKAGAFSGCFKVAYTFDVVVYYSEWGEWPMDATSYQWFKPYVGFVRSYTVINLPTPLPDSEVTEELLSYDLPP
jgi:hypothetical protein